MVELSRITQDTTTSASEVEGAHGSLETPDIEGGPEPNSKSSAYSGHSLYAVESV